MSLGKAAIKSAEATQIFFDMLEQSGDDSDQDSVNKIANDSELTMPQPSQYRN